jgi:hypothetical protein
MHREKYRPLVRLASGAPVFANGAATAAMAYAFNQAQSDDPVEEFLSASESLEGETEIVRQAQSLSLEDFTTLFPSYADFARSYGVSEASLLLFEEFRAEVLESGRLLDVAKKGVPVIRQHAQRQVFRGVGAVSKTFTVLGRAAGLSDRQIRLGGDILKVRAHLNHANLSVKNLSALATQIRDNPEIYR